MRNFAREYPIHIEKTAHKYIDTGERKTSEEIKEDVEDFGEKNVKKYDSCGELIK